MLLSMWVSGVKINEIRSITKERFPRQMLYYPKPYARFTTEKI